jgi:hypothetical protein
MAWVSRDSGGPDFLLGSAQLRILLQKPSDYHTDVPRPASCSFLERKSQICLSPPRAGNRPQAIRVTWQIWIGDRAEPSSGRFPAASSPLWSAGLRHLRESRRCCGLCRGTGTHRGVPVAVAVSPPRPTSLALAVVTSRRPKNWNTVERSTGEASDPLRATGSRTNLLRASRALAAAGPRIQSPPNKTRTRPNWTARPGGPSWKAIRARAGQPVPHSLACAKCRKCVR